MSKNTLHLFQGLGIELEYMIVRKDSLHVNPVCDEIIKAMAGSYTTDTEYKNIGWSNELVLHVIELKTPEPVNNLNNLDKFFAKSIKKINKLLDSYDSQLMPSGSHPFMNPEKETKLWPHEYNAVYQSYDKIFGCKGHGWSNLQSVHLNLPFANDDEFGRLHAAIRLLLPIIPALTSSSPILDGHLTDYKDMRLAVYQNNQKIIPSIAGEIIPERVFSKVEYENIILKKIYNDIAEYDKENILRYEWLNSRGAIARFDRNAIEIRIIDTQEAPIVDMAIIFVIVETLKIMINEVWTSYEKQKLWLVKPLLNLFQEVIKYAEFTDVVDYEYLNIFNIKEKCSVKDLWEKIISNIDFSGFSEFKSVINNIIEEGTLSTRIINKLNNNYSLENITSVYKNLADCLNENKMFL
ncbi:MAG: glutamate-cysteine ligase family protein [Ignavibacteriaceae bacterium]